jgi:biotin carboxyl carrier protein
MTRDITADIAASVVRVEVAVGDVVAADQALVVLESMKMEIPVESPMAGRVVEVRVAPEDRVEEGDVLVVIEEAS